MDIEICPDKQINEFDISIFERPQKIISIAKDATFIEFQDRGFFPLSRKEGLQHAEVPQCINLFCRLTGKTLAPASFVDQKISQVVIDFWRIPYFIDSSEYMVMVLFKVNRIVFSQAFK